MVRLLWLSLIAPLLLTACDLLTGSPFPSNLPFVSAFADVSGELGSFLEGRSIDDLDYVCYTMQDNDRRDYLLLLLRVKGSGESKLLVFDGRLEKREELDNRDFGLFALYNGSSALLPSGGELVVGLEAFDGDSLEHAGHLAWDFGVVNPPQPMAVGFADEATGRIYQVEVDGLGELVITDWDTAWNSGSTTNLGSAGPRSPVRLDFDPESAQAVIFFGGSTGTEAVRYPSWHFPALDTHGVPGFPFASTFDTVDGMIVLDGAQPNLCHYTRDGIVATDPDGEMVRFDFSGDELDSRDLGDGSYMAAFALAGSHYYYLDLDELRLYKERTWWD